MTTKTTKEERRKKRRIAAITGLISGTAGVSLLIGGSSFALWSAEGSATGGTVTAGNLDLDVATAATWYDITANRSDTSANATMDKTTGHLITTISDYRIIPGDTLEADVPVTIALEGDNMISALSLKFDSLVSTFADGKISFTYSVVALDDDDKINTAASGTTGGYYVQDQSLTSAATTLAVFAPVDDSSAAGGAADTTGVTATINATAKVGVIVRVTFASDTGMDDTSKKAISTGATAVLSSMKLTLTQIVDSGKGNWTTATGTATTEASTQESATS